MANCIEYQNLDLQERLKAIGCIVHLFQNDTESFIAMSSMVRSAEQSGKLDAVTILPQSQEPETY